MRKLALRAVAALALLIVVTFLARNVIARKAVELAVRSRTGFPLQIERVDIHALRGRLEVEDLRLHNPSGFPDDRFVRISSLRIDYDPASFLRRAPHVRELRVRLDEVVVVTDERGRSNTTLLGQKLSEGEERAPKRRQPYRIDVMRLHVGKVVLVDLSHGRRSERTIALDLDAVERNLSESTDLTGLVVRGALREVGPHVGGVFKGLGNALQGAGRGVEGAGKGVLDLFRRPR